MVLAACLILVLCWECLILVLCWECLILVLCWECLILVLCWECLILVFFIRKWFIKKQCVIAQNAKKVQYWTFETKKFEKLMYT